LADPTCLVLTQPYFLLALTTGNFAYFSDILCPTLLSLPTSSQQACYLITFKPSTPAFDMATTARRQYSYAPAPQKTLPITMPSKAPAYHYPVSRIAMSPPEMSDSSTTYSGSRSSGQSYSARSSNYAASQSSDEGYNSASGVDVVDMLSERMNSAFEPIRMDKSLAKQAQT